MNPQEKIKELVELLNKYSEEYYNNDVSLVSDFEYDSLLRELETLEKEYPEFILPNSPTKRVGDFKETELEKVYYQTPMLSLGNAFNYYELREFDQRIKKEGYTIIPLELFLSHGFAKIEIGLAKGKKLYDKREAIAKKTVDRDISRQLKR